ncbi:hypothetical protein [Flavobacterium davisii]|uniref:Uncharacterized protein n=1 Tax=Flavobacterium columnare TaxID=996 RepID=A0A8G0P6P7_9FLAO|nr:hypothetical protein [Flavobacterium davisii]QYS89327.1 hypothetical protein JJC05_02890 [Flavobacterium davisii]
MQIFLFEPKLRIRFRREDEKAKKIEMHEKFFLKIGGKSYNLTNRLLLRFNKDIKREERIAKINKELVYGVFYILKTPFYLY